MVSCHGGLPPARQSPQHRTARRMQPVRPYPMAPAPKPASSLLVLGCATVLAVGVGGAGPDVDGVGHERQGIDWLMFAPWLTGSVAPV